MVKNRNIELWPDLITLIRLRTSLCNLMYCIDCGGPQELGKIAAKVFYQTIRV